MKKTPLKRKTRLRPRSPRRQKEDREYSRLRKEFLEAHPVCFVYWREHPGVLSYEEKCACVRNGLMPNPCPSTVIHHKFKRGKNYLNTNTWLALSERNHARVEGDYTYDGLPYGKSWAREQGYLANI